jgi:hypothetical protein
MKKLTRVPLERVTLLHLQHERTQSHKH